jgi:hypothetical protein
MIVRLIANGSILVGVYLFARMLYGSVNGSLAAQLFPESQEAVSNTVVVLALSLPLPFHVISVGLLLQRCWLSHLWARIAFLAVVSWLSHLWARIAFLAVVISGCWLGVAIGIKFLVFP